MARRQKTGAAEDLLVLVAMLPWWVGIVLAVVGYVVLHRFAMPAPVVTMQPGQIGAVVVRSMGAALANVGQYVLPLICLGGAGLSAWRRRQRQSLVADVAQAHSADALDGMSWREFEILVGEAFRLQGFRVVETGGGGADGGVDLVLGKGNEKFLVQCKQWKAFKVGVEVVRELYGVMAAEGAAGGFVVTSGIFSNDVKSFAEGRNVELIGGADLMALIKNIPLPQTSSITSQRKATNTVVFADPICPNCGSAMVKRKAKQGANAGNMFWGCNSYPKCRGVVAIN